MMEILDFEEQDLFVYEDTLERLYQRQDYLRIWRVKHINHLHIFCYSVRSHLICLIKFHKLYIRQIPRIPYISFDRIRLSSATHLFRIRVQFSFFSHSLYPCCKDRVMRNHFVRRPSPSVRLIVSFFYDLLHLRRTFAISIFEDENFLLEGKNYNDLKSE